MIEPKYLVPLRFDSSVLPEEEQFATFTAASVNFDISRSGDGPFAARALIWRIGGVIVVRQTTDAVSWRRSAERVRADRVDYIYINYHYTGRFTIDAGHSIRRGGAGALFAVDMRQPVGIDDEAMRKIYVAMPRRALLDRLDGYDPHGMVLDGAATALLGATLNGVCDALPRMTAAQVPMTEQLLLDLVARTLLAGLRDRGTRNTREDELASRVHAYIDAHLGDMLDVPTLCQQIGVSRSNLYRAFGAEGGVLRQIQARRLRRLRALLLDPSETRSVAELALAHGFADKSHFTRLFKQAFGLTPGAFRRASAGPPPRPHASDDQLAMRFADLVRELS